MFAIVIALLGLAGCGRADIPNVARGVWLADAVASLNARCLDGTPAHYYVRRATSSVNATKWYIHQQGGGWCTSDASCLSRSKSRLGSSLEKYNNHPQMDFNNIEGCNNSRWCGPLMSNDPMVNPLAYDWNAVLFMYCDGGSFAGDRTEPVTVQGETIYYRGWSVFRAIVDSLSTSEGMAHAEVILFGGDSAGGLATYLHSDHIKSVFPKARVYGLPDSGFFMDMDSKTREYHTNLVWVFHAMNATAGVNQHCLAANHDDPSRCMFAQHTAPHTDTPLFAFQSRFDSYQTGSILGSSDAQAINVFGDNLTETAQSALGIKDSTSRNGLALDSCHHHCGGWGIFEGGVSALSAFTQWFLQLERRMLPTERLFFQHERYPCQWCCANMTQSIQ